MRSYQPVVIIGAPRSGTNMLRDILCKFDGVSTWPCDEINYIWRHGNLTYPSDELPYTLASSSVKKYIRKQFDWVAKNYDASIVIEKTCANSLRIPFVDKVIPEAKYIYIVRNGIDVTGSAKLRWTAKLNMNEGIANHFSACLPNSEDFYVNENNLEASELIKIWPNWFNGAAIIYGPDKSGKSHLASIWKERSNANIYDLDNKVKTIEIFYKEGQAMPVVELGEGISVMYVTDMANSDFELQNTQALYVTGDADKVWAWAESLKAYNIFIGVNSLDYSGYPDCRPEFIKSFEKTANLATKIGVEGKKISIHTPLINLTKGEIIQLGLSLGVNYGLTSTCYDPKTNGNPCGSCDACILRIKGFNSASEKDPLDYSN